MTSSLDALRAAVAATGWLDLLRALVRTPSHPGLVRQEEAVVAVLASFLETQGFACTLHEIAPGRPNLLCTLEGAAPGRHLVLCAHTDTVPLNLSDPGEGFSVGSSRVDLQACKLEYSIVSPK